MAHLSKIFEEAPIRVQNRNGFDLSHTHSGTSKCGQLVPVLTKLLPPNTTISLGVNAEVNLPPIVAPFYGKIDFAIEGFVVPCSILYGGWKQFISNQEWAQFPANQSALISSDSNSQMITTSSNSGVGYLAAANKSGYQIPKFNLIGVSNSDTASWATLMNANNNIYGYMGCKTQAAYSSTSTPFYLSLLPAIAYHKIVDTFYRNTKLTRTWFAVNPNVGRSNTGDSSGVSSAPSMYNNKNVSLIWHSFYTATDDISVVSPETTATWNTTSAIFGTTSQLTFPDGVSVFSTRQRTYMRDYFTSAVYNPQQGGSSALKFAVDVSTAGSENGQFTINALRAANSLQKFLETNNLSGDYADMVRNRWGIRPIDADFEEPHYLGRVVIPVYQHKVYKQDALESNGSGFKVNPWVADGYLGAQAGAAQADGEGSICDNFNVSCWSYLMCLASLYPHANYTYGINRELSMTTLGDFPAPELQTIGMESIKNWEITGGTNVDSNNRPYTVVTSNFFQDFGYIGRYSRFKYMDDSVSGELQPGRTMSAYQLQRSFLPADASSPFDAPSLGTSFVTIAQDALDGVLAVSTATANLTCWWEIYFSFHAVMPLADFQVPTLGELQDTHTIKTTTSGSRL